MAGGLPERIGCIVAALGLACAAAAQGGTAPATPKEAGEQVKPLHQTVVVTAAREEQEITAASSLVTVLPRADMERTAALTLDDQLRRVPGFSLFRRSSSLVAHPTTQGVSLRGIGPSGAGRSLVLFDGIPLNDPFGGWIYWNRIPAGAVESVEIVRGASSQLYGNSAMGGAIQLLGRRPGERQAEARVQYGMENTYDVNALVSERRGRFEYLLGGRIFGTDGFFLIAPANRGAVDIPARSAHQSALARVRFGGFHAGANLFREKRGNGTPLQNNNSHLALIDIGYTRPTWRWNFYGQPGLFESTFSAIGARRATETPTERQRNPTAALGSSLSGSPWSARRSFQAGVDWRYARAMAHAQNFTGAFLHDRIALSPRTDFVAGLRLDAWQNRATHASLNPRAGLVVRAAESVTLRATGYRGFRAPTLNELYRPFRAGNILTTGNPDLREERLWGAETGADFHPTGSVLVRLNGFWNALDGPVGNVTLSSAGGTILRQRRNLGSATIRGFEAEATARAAHRWQARASYLYSDARVDQTRLLIPQTARHQGAASLSWFGPFTATFEARAFSRQFDDDLNRLPLPGYMVLDFFVRREMGKRAALFLAVENLTGRAYAVARTPLEQLGTPRLVHGGVQFRLR